MYKLVKIKVALSTFLKKKLLNVQVLHNTLKKNLLFKIFMYSKKKFKKNCCLYPCKTFKKNSIWLSLITLEIFFNTKFIGRVKIIVLHYVYLIEMKYWGN